MSAKIEHFNLQGMDEYSDEYAISIAIDCAKLLLRNPKISTRQIISLGIALYALERMPTTTPGTFVEFGVVYRVDSDYPEMQYLNFLISESCFEISRGGSINLGAGFDSFSDPSWRIEVGGYRETECELYSIENEVIELLNLGGKITVYDESHIEYDSSEQSAQHSDNSEMDTSDSWCVARPSL